MRPMAILPILALAYATAVSTLHQIIEIDTTPHTVLTMKSVLNFSWTGDQITPEFRHVSRWAFLNFTVLTCSHIGCDDERSYCPSPSPVRQEVVNGPTNVRAVTCTIYPCVRTYTASITNNELSEKMTGSALLSPEILNLPYTLDNILSLLPASSG